MKEEIANRLRKARNQQGLSRNQASELIGFSVSTIKRHESPLSAPTDLLILKKYAEIYVVSPVWLSYGLKLAPSPIETLFSKAPESVKNAILTLLKNIC